MPGNQAAVIELKHAINHVMYQAVGGAEAVVGLPMRLASFGVGFNVAVNQLPVGKRSGFGGLSQHAPHAGHLLVATQ